MHYMSISHRIFISHDVIQQQIFANIAQDNNNLTL